MFEFALILMVGAALAVAVTALCRASRAAQAAQQAERKVVAHEAARRLAEVPEQPIPSQRRPWYLQPVGSAGKILAAVCAGAAAMAGRQRSAFALAAATAASVGFAVFVAPDDEDTQAAPPRPLPAESKPGAFDLPRVPPSVSSSPAPTSTPAPESPSVPTAPPAPTDRQTPTSTAPAPADTDTDTGRDASGPTTRTSMPPSSEPTARTPTPPDGRRDARCINSPAAPICVDLRHLDRLRDKITEEVLD